MPRPHVDRVARSVRLPAELDRQFVDEAKRRGLSVNAALELAAQAWVGTVPELPAVDYDPIPVGSVDPGTTERRSGPRPPTPVPFERVNRLKPTKKGTP